MDPEEKARLVIDRKLEASGWVLQDMDEYNPKASLGVAVREFMTNDGDKADYALFIEGKPVGVIEAKKSNDGHKLKIQAAEQSSSYLHSGLKYFVEKEPMRFTYEATDVLTHFCDFKDEKPRTRKLFSFHRPEYLQKLIKENNTLRNNLKHFPEFNKEGFRACQVNAIINLEQSFAQNKPRALVQMATGAGKTFTAITSVYRLLKYANAKRILFLVDTKNLGEQAEEEFRNYKPNDDARLFTELYTVHRLNSSFIPNDAKVCISTIQRMYAILKGEELNEAAEEISQNELHYNREKAKEVVYNPKFPPEFFDFIIIDECHRSIYNLWQQVLDYFDAFLIGLTATPDQRTFAFFDENVVSEYTHEQAVLDGVNVGREGTFLIETDKTKNGGCILKQEVEVRERLSRRKRWLQLDEDFNYVASELDKKVVSPSQIRNVIRTFKENLPLLFPGRAEVPKTLVFAKTDSHADDIITIIREEFGEGNEFCKKITYGSEDNPKTVLSSFRNEFYPRIAVTVDMIATGTDVKPLECLVFMRDVRSKNYFEQMLGRATRTISKEDLMKVTPSAKEKKLHYVVVDAVGVMRSQKTTSRQLERKFGVSLKQLLLMAVSNNKDEDVLTSLANRLVKLQNVLDPKEEEKVRALTGGVSLSNIAANLLDAFDEDKIEEVVDTIPNKEDLSPVKQREIAQNQLIEKALEPIYPAEFRNYIIKLRETHDQVIDPTLDTVTFAGFDTDHENAAKQAIVTFREFIEANKDEITALNIIYNQSYQQRALTLDMIKEVHEAMQHSPYLLSVNKLWNAFEFVKDIKARPSSVERKLVDIVSLLRFELGQTKKLTPFAEEVNQRFKKWIFDKNKGYGQFTEEQTAWLQMIREHIKNSVNITEEDLDLSPFDEKGGWNKFYRLFGDNYKTILTDINYALVA